MLRADEQAALAEVGKCRGDYWYWATRYGKIPYKADEDGIVKVEGFRPRREQVQVRDAISRYRQVFILKARQLGITTECGLNRLWWVMMTPYFRHGVLAHTETAAKAIFQVNYVDVYDRLPPLFKKLFPLKRCNDGQMLFAHGGEIVVSSAESPSFAGRPFGSYHFSEYAKYQNEEKLMRDVMAGASPNAQVVYETNADGFNHAHKNWYADNGIHKIFLPWTDAAEYVADEAPVVLREDIERYARTYKLGVRQKNFVYKQTMTRYRGVLRSFHQNFPATPELAFISSGDKFFTKNFPHAQATPGYRRHKNAEAGVQRSFVMGVDTASGAENGDFSAFVVLDVTDVERPRIVATYYERVKPNLFAKRVLEEAQFWNAVVVPETNSYGLSVLEYLIAQGWGKIYRDKGHDSATGKFSQKLGFWTGKASRELLLNQLSSTVDQEWFDVWDSRLQVEINAFAFNDDDPPKAEAGAGHHDDILIALALALIGRGQALTKQERAQTKRPQTFQELRDFYIRNGRPVGPDDVFEDDDMSVQASPLQSASLFAGQAR